MGRANTLKIRKLRENEDYKGIYEALKTYDRISPGEVIVVENEAGDKAYFGELNANLAIRSGALGTIVGGCTRDVEEVTKLDFPVFSTGYSSADVKKRATFDGHQIPISISGISIFPGDIIFADICGVVRIPQNKEKEVIAKALQVIKTEKSILNRILNDENAEKIYELEGEF